LKDLTPEMVAAYGPRGTALGEHYEKLDQWMARYPNLLAVMTAYHSHLGKLDSTSLVMAKLVVTLLEAANPPAALSTTEEEEGT